MIELLRFREGGHVRLVDIADSEVTVSMFWQQAELIARVLEDAAYNGDATPGYQERATIETMAAAFKSAAVAAFAHGRVTHHERFTLKAMNQHIAARNARVATPAPDAA